MSYKEMLTAISLEAGGDLSANQYTFVDVASDGQVDVVSTAGAKAVGVLQDEPAAAGRVAKVGIEGVSKIKAGAAVTRGVEVVSDASGRAIAKSAADQFVMGTALESATAADQIIAVRLKSYQASS